MKHPVTNPLRVTDEVTVLRSSGEYEPGWYLWTDMEAFPEYAYTAPEMIRVLVVKPTDGSDLAEMLRPGNQVQWISKKVSLGELYTWQNTVETETPDPRTNEPYQPGKEAFLKRVDDLRKLRQEREAEEK